MSELLTGKKAIVTGASKGIGLEIGRALLSEGADVVICSRDPKAVENAVTNLNKDAKPRKVSGCAADVSYIMPGSVDTAFAGHDAKQKSDWKIAPEDIAEIVLDILRKPGRTLISRVEVRPSRPQKY